MDYSAFVKKALITASTGDKNKLSSYFHADTTLFLPPGPYRIEGLEQYSEIVERLQSLGIVLQYLHIRQPTVISISEDSAFITFHFTSRAMAEGIPLPSLGYCTVIVIKGKIRHLHLSRNRLGAIGDSSSAALNLDGVAPNALTQFTWSDSPGEP